MGYIFLTIMGRKIPICRPWLFINILTVLLMSLLFLRVYVLYLTIDTARSHPDEEYWMQSTYFYHLFIQEKDVSNKDWDNFISYDQPPVGKYVLGFSLDTSHHQVALTNGGLKNWYNFAVKNWFVPKLKYLSIKSKHSEDLRNIRYAYFLIRETKDPRRATHFMKRDYHAGRVGMLMVGVLATGLLIVMVSFVLKNIVLGLLSGLIFLNNSMVVPTFQQILIDPICCFFILSSLLVLFWLFHELFINERLRSKIILLSILEGGLLAFAVGTKFITTYMIVTVGLVFITSILIEIVKSWKLMKPLLIRPIILRLSILILIGLSTGIFFVLLNPFLYHNTIDNAIKMAQHRFIFMEMQQNIHFASIRNFEERIATIYEWGVLLDYTFHNIFEFILYNIIFLVGLVVLVKRSLDELVACFIGPMTIVLLWVAASFVINGSMIPIQWERYYIPFVMCTCLILSLGLAVLMKAIGRAIKIVFSISLEGQKL